MHPSPGYAAAVLCWRRFSSIRARVGREAPAEQVDSVVGQCYPATLPARLFSERRPRSCCSSSALCPEWSLAGTACCEAAPAMRARLHSQGSTSRVQPRGPFCELALQRDTQNGMVRMLSSRIPDERLRYQQLDCRCYNGPTSTRNLCTPATAPTRLRMQAYCTLSHASLIAARWGVASRARAHRVAPESTRLHSNSYSRDELSPSKHPR
jgi:hypothetical protein